MTKMETNDFVFSAITDLQKSVERTNRRINRIRFTNKVYFGLSLLVSYAVYKELQQIIKETKEKNEE